MKTESGNNPTTVRKSSDREVVVTRTFDSPARLVFEAWSRAELFKQWWVPRSLGATLQSCELDVRTGGTYRLVSKLLERGHRRLLHVEPVRPG